MPVIGAGYWEGIGANVKREATVNRLTEGYWTEGTLEWGRTAKKGGFRLSVEIARKKIHLHIEFQHTVEQVGLLHLCILNVISHSPLLQ